MIKKNRFCLRREREKSAFKVPPTPRTSYPPPPIALTRVLSPFLKGREAEGTTSPGEPAHPTLTGRGRRRRSNPTTAIASWQAPSLVEFPQNPNMPGGQGSWHLPAILICQVDEKKTCLWVMKNVWECRVMTLNNILGGLTATELPT